MTPKESYNQTFEFKDHYVIYKNPKKKGSKYKNKTGETGIRVKKDFEYSSEMNKVFLNIEQIKKLNKLV